MKLRLLGGFRRLQVPRPASDHDPELDLPVELPGPERTSDVVEGPDHRVRVLEEDHGLLRWRVAGFGCMRRVVLADAEHRGGPCDGWPQPPAGDVQTGQAAAAQGVADPPDPVGGKERPVDVRGDRREVEDLVAVLDRGAFVAWIADA
jgi:hypothetical protein